MGVFEFIISVLSIALVFITIWILILRKDRRASIEPQGEYSMSELSAMAKSMQERIDILESILDAEVPDWREQNEPGGH